MENGSCLQRTDLPWIVDRPTATERLEMATVCGSCPVLAQCRLFAVGARVTAGFWAGAPRGDQLLQIPSQADPVSRPVAGSSDVGGAA
ncbi:WhiB family transcriptional regulator [Cellulomonas aerilata]